MGSVPRPDALFTDLPPALGESKRYTSLKKAFDDYLYYNQHITLWHNPHVDLYSEPKEARDDFIERLRPEVEKARQEEEEKLEARYQKDLERLEKKLDREEQELEEDEIDFNSRRQGELLSGAETVLALFTGGKLGRRLSSASSKRRMTRKAKADLEESKVAIERLEQDIEELSREHAEALEALADEWEERLEELEQVEVTPRRADVQIKTLALAWLPHWVLPIGNQLLTLPAYDAAE